MSNTMNLEVPKGVGRLNFMDIKGSVNYSRTTLLYGIVSWLVSLLIHNIVLSKI
jgi:hypothetical protein